MHVNVNIRSSPRRQTLTQVASLLHVASSTLSSCDWHCRPDFDRCKAKGHGWRLAQPDDFTIAQNLLCQLNSVQHVNRLWHAEHVKAPYSAVIFARPDVVFNCPLSAGHLTALQVRAAR